MAEAVSIIIGMCILVLESKLSISPGLADAQVIALVWIIFMLYRSWSSTITDIKLPHSTLAFEVRLVKRVMVYTAYALLVYL